MNRKILAVLTLIFTLTIFSAVNAADKVWRLDGVPENFPRNFRVTDASKFYASASGQPTFSELKNLFYRLKNIAPNDKKIYIVDLRQESHGYADEYPVSWYVLKNKANVDKTFSEIERDEIKRLKNLRGKLTEFLPLGNYDTEHFNAVKFAPKVTLTEKRAAELAGFNYVRFYAQDMAVPSPEVVDEYLKFIAQIDSDTWLHFHCQAGHGRTTTFLVMYDILQHPDSALEDIVQRQYKLGGSNLFDGGDKETFIKLFYKYAHELQDKNFSSTWSDWLKNNVA